MEEKICRWSSWPWITEFDVLSNLSLSPHVSCLSLHSHLLIKETWQNNSHILYGHIWRRWAHILVACTEFSKAEGTDAGEKALLKITLRLHCVVVSFPQFEAGGGSSWRWRSRGRTWWGCWTRWRWRTETRGWRWPGPSSTWLRVRRRSTLQPAVGLFHSWHVVLEFKWNSAIIHLNISTCTYVKYIN